MQASRVKLLSSSGERMFLDLFYLAPVAESRVWCTDQLTVAQHVLKSAAVGVKCLSMSSGLLGLSIHSTFADVCHGSQHVRASIRPADVALARP